MPLARYTGEAGEIWIGKSEIQRLRIPTLELLMDEVAVNEESKASAEAGGVIHKLILEDAPSENTKVSV